MTTGLKIVEMKKACSKCKILKPFSDFHRNKDRGVGVQPRCKKCRNQSSKDAYKSNPKVRRSGIKNRPDKLKRFYGIEYADVVRTFDAQLGLCANRSCGKDISLETSSGKNRAVIDHNHETGKFRALLCMQCNLTLGYLEKQPNIILGLTEYLSKHNSQGDK